MTWYFDDETTPATRALLDRVSQTGAIVPGLWRLEVANAFQSALQRCAATVDSQSGVLPRTSRNRFSRILL
jgi:hypothetical protein